jgi:hypothetical protein
MPLLHTQSQLRYFGHRLSGLSGAKPERSPCEGQDVTIPRSSTREWPWRAIRGEKTIAEIAVHHEVHPTQVTSWKDEVLEKLVGIFGGEKTAIAMKRRVSASCTPRPVSSPWRESFWKVRWPERQALIDRVGSFR